MKALVFAMIVILFGHQVECQAVCRNDCRNLSGMTMCTLMKAKCNDRRIALFCQLTCNRCRPCTAARSISTAVVTNCEVGTCVDLRNPVECAIINQRMNNGCIMFGNTCRATCGLCRGCTLPPTELVCSEDCKDSNNESCTYWKKQGYCDVSKGFPHTRIACPLSCGTCKLCPTEPLTTTAKNCTKCEDTNQFCGHWKNEGYCDVTKGFPDTLKACPKACEVCKPCSGA